VGPGILAARMVPGIGSVCCSSASSSGASTRAIIAMLGTYRSGSSSRDVRGLLGGHYSRFRALRRFTLFASTSRVGAMMLLTTLCISRHLAIPFTHVVGGAGRGSLENPIWRAAAESRRQALRHDFPWRAWPAWPAALIVPLYQLSADIGTRFLVQAFLSVMLGGVGTFGGTGAGLLPPSRHAAACLVVIPVLADPLVFVIAFADREVPSTGVHYAREALIMTDEPYRGCAAQSWSPRLMGAGALVRPLDRRRAVGS